MRRATRRLTWALAALGMTAGAAQASPVTYTIQGTVTGSLDGTSFTDQSITITTTTDTAGVQNPNPGFYEVLAPAPTIEVSGFAPVTLSDSVYVFDNQSNPSAGVFGTVDPFDILDTNAAPFATYDLTTSIGPVSGTPVYNPFFNSYSTSGGTLVIRSASAASFQAVVNAAAVPEPSTLGGAALATLVGIGYARRKRRGG